MPQFDPEPITVPAPLVALAAWIIPGAGYWVIGQRTRGTIVGVTILSLFFLGILIAGVRVIEVPGFDRQHGAALRLKTRSGAVNPNSPLLLTNGGFISEIVAKPWFVPQTLVGPIGLAGGAVSVIMGQADVRAPLARIADIGTLYTAVAGMLNLLAVIDSAHRAGNPNPSEEDVDSPVGSAVP